MWQAFDVDGVAVVAVVAAAAVVAVVAIATIVAVAAAAVVAVVAAVAAVVAVYVVTVVVAVVVPVAVAAVYVVAVVAVVVVVVVVHLILNWLPFDLSFVWHQDDESSAPEFLLPSKKRKTRSVRFRVFSPIRSNDPINFGVVPRQSGSVDKATNILWMAFH